MKKILSVLLALVMILSMIPVIASAATESLTITFDASKTQRTSFSTTQQVWTEGNLTFTNDKASSSNAVADYSNPVRLYQGSTVTIAVAEGNITEILIVSDGTAKYKTALENSIKGAGATYTNSGNNYTVALDGNSGSFTMSMTAQARFKSITVTYATVEAEGCAHTNTEAIEAKDPTCVLPGNTAGIKCADCGLLLEGNELIEAPGHTEGEGVVTAPTCTEDGHTDYTCAVCGNVRKVWVDATGHDYVNGVCSGCGLALPANLEGKYYIAAIRSSGNYWYMTSDVGTASTLRYQIVDSGLTTLPEIIAAPVDAQTFELVAVDGGYVIKTGNKYLGWTSGNSGIVVDEANAKVVTIEYGTEDGTYNIHFAASETEERYLSLNNNAANAYYAWYTGGQVQNLVLVPVSTVACAHEDSGESDAVAATCTEVGYTAGVYCNDCENFISGHEEIPALGHNYVDGVCANGCGIAEIVTPSEATIDFSDANQRKSWDASSQIWENNSLKLTNNKASSTSNIADYTNPARFYKSSELIIEFPGMTKIIVVCNSATYATALKNSISDSSATVTVDGSTVTIELSAAVDSYTIASLSGGQVRANSITVQTAKTCTHNWEVTGTTAPTCTDAGATISKCSLCNEEKTDAIDALGHTYTFAETAVSCSVCSVSINKSNIGDLPKAASTTLYYIEGVVTFVDGRNVYIEDSTGGICVYHANGEQKDAAIGDIIRVCDSLTVYNGLVETTETLYAETQKVSSDNELPCKATTLVELTADADAKTMLSTRIALTKVTVTEVGEYSTQYKNVDYTVSDGTNTIKIYRAPAATAEEVLKAGDVINVTAVVSSHNGYQLRIAAQSDIVLAPTSVEITHISLNPGLDALGYKAATTNAPEGSTIEISLWVDEDIVATKTVEEGKALRLKNIMKYNGGEMTIYAKATLKDAEGNVIAESAVADTTMKDTIIAVNSIGNQLTDEQALAVYNYYVQNKTIMDAWLGDNNDIQNWEG